MAKLPFLHYSSCVVVTMVPKRPAPVNPTTFIHPQSGALARISSSEREFSSRGNPVSHTYESVFSTTSLTDTCQNEPGSSNECSRAHNSQSPERHIVPTPGFYPSHLIPLWLALRKGMACRGEETGSQTSSRT